MAEVGGSQHLAPAGSSRLPKNHMPPNHISLKKRNGKSDSELPGVVVFRHARLPARLLCQFKGGAGREVAGGKLTVRGLEARFLEQESALSSLRRRCCIQHPRRVDSSHPDPERHASGGLTQTPGRGIEEAKRLEEKEEEKRESTVRGKGMGEGPGEKEGRRRRDSGRKEGEQSGGREKGKWGGGAFRY